MAQMSTQTARPAAARPAPAAHRLSMAQGARRLRAPGAAGARPGAAAVAVEERAEVELVRRQEQGDDIIIFTFGSAKERAAAEQAEQAASQVESNVVTAPAGVSSNGKVSFSRARKAASATSPAWWAPPAAVYVEPGFRREIQAEAQAIASRMLNSKTLGQAFTIRPLVTIRQLCADTGAAVDMRPHTESLYSFAAGAAANSAAEQSSELGGQLQGRFLSGLAQDLGIEQEEAVKVVSGVVASRAQAALLAACASFSKGDNSAVLVELLKLAGLLTALPLPPRCSHAAEVASDIQQRASLEERQAVFLTYGCMDPASSDMVAELLGFEPDLVLPELEKQIAEARGGVAALA